MKDIKKCYEYGKIILKYNPEGGKTDLIVFNTSMYHYRMLFKLTAHGHDYLFIRKKDNKFGIAYNGIIYT